ncbi:hypothetical protein PROCOU_04101 [Listeria rocourtiae FSL F6-920]|nr:hypothetical protein PROCOU_04101 [Listeria rocourtiae FSL F6-920]
MERILTTAYIYHALYLMVMLIQRLRATGGLHAHYIRMHIEALIQQRMLHKSRNNNKLLPNLPQL